jgi:hypothetical protein
MARLRRATLILAVSTIFDECLEDYRNLDDLGDLEQVDEDPLPVRDADDTFVYHRSSHRGSAGPTTAGSTPTWWPPPRRSATTWPARTPGPRAASPRRSSWQPCSSTPRRSWTTPSSAGPGWT